MAVPENDSDNVSDKAIVMAGIPATNHSLYHRIRFSVGDPAAFVEMPDAAGQRRSVLILRDIEMQRARKSASVDQVACPADFTPESGLSGDRETATAQAVAECLRRNFVDRVVADRSLPLIYVHEIQLAGIEVDYDPELGVIDRRRKDATEIEFLREAQQATEAAMEMACRMVGQADVDDNGTLIADGRPLTSERIRQAIDFWFLERGYRNPAAIVAGGPAAADCHDIGSGELKTGQPVIIDIFPCNRKTGYNGDCTRTVVHGEISSQISQMHQAVVAAKQAAIDACRAGVTGEQVHAAVAAVMRAAGFAMGLPGEDDPETYCGMTHGTGHGIGLDVHEPPLLDKGGPVLLAGDALTIEPGLYSRAVGGVRVEDMVVVTDDGCENLNTLPEGLTWN